MPRKLPLSSKEFIIDAPLPTHTDTYTVISHKFIIDKIFELCDANGLVIEKEQYASNFTGEVARGLYHIKSDTDPDLSMAFSWVNSYDKSLRFRCAISGRIKVSDAVIIPGNQASFSRIHKGTADLDVANKISEQITNANNYYNTIIADKNIMKSIKINEKERARLVGQMYIYHQLMTANQIGVCKNELAKPTFQYDTSNETLWYLYNCIAFALKDAHPKTWIDQHMLLHLVLKNEYLDNFILPAGSVESESAEEPQSDVPTNQLVMEFEEPKKEDAAEVPGDTPIEELIVPEELVSEDLSATETESIVSEGITEDITDESELPIDNSWVCLTCGKTMSEDDVMYGDQQCFECFSKNS